MDDSEYELGYSRTDDSLDPFEDYLAGSDKYMAAGLITDISPEGIVVNLGKRNVFIPASDLGELSETPEIDQLVYVDVVSNDDGLQASLSRLVYLNQDWSRAKQLLDEGATIEGKVVGHNRGGALVEFGRLRGFVPMSQLSDFKAGMQDSDKQQMLSKLRGTLLSLKIIEVDRRRRRLVMSNRLKSDRFGAPEGFVPSLEIPDMPQNPDKPWGLMEKLRELFLETKKLEEVNQVEEVEVRIPNKAMKKKQGSFVHIKLESTNLKTLSQGISIAYLKEYAIPYIENLTQIQHIMDEINGHPRQNIMILSINHGSITVDLTGGIRDSIELVMDVVVPWRRKNKRALAELAVNEKETALKKQEVEVEQAKEVLAQMPELAENEGKLTEAEIKNKEAEAERIKAEVRKIDAETQQQMLANQKMQLEMMKLALEMVKSIKSDLPEEQLLLYAMKMIEPTRTIAMSPLELVDFEMIEPIEEELADDQPAPSPEDTDSETTTGDEDTDDPQTN